METDTAKQRQIDVSVCDTSGEEGTSRYVGALEARAFVFFFFKSGERGVSAGAVQAPTLALL